MRTSTFFIWLAAALCAPLMVSAKSPPDKPFRRVLVLASEGFATPLALGVLEGLSVSGWKPDLILTTGDTAIAGAFIQMYPEPALRLDFARSHDLWSFWKEAEFSDFQASRWELLAYRSTPHWAMARKVPSVFTHFSHQIRLPLLPESFDAPFRAEAPAVAMIGSEILFPRRDEGTPARKKKLFREALFSDRVTAQKLQNWPSALGQKFERSLVAPQASAVGDASLLFAAHVSRSSPLHWTPFRIGPRYFGTGAIDPLPVDLAASLGEEVIVTYPRAPSTAQKMAIAAHFGLDSDAVMKSALKNRHVRWVDLSDLSLYHQRWGLDAATGFVERAREKQLAHAKDLTLIAQSQMDHLLLSPSVKRPSRALGVPPASFPVYLDMVDKLYALGLARGTEAARSEVGDQQHIRRPLRRRLRTTCHSALAAAEGVR